MPSVTFHYGDQKKTVQGESGKTLLEIGLQDGVPIEHACGGNGFCTTCLCKVKQGAENLAAPNDREESMGVSGEERLACQAQVLQDDVTVELESM